MEKEFKNIQGKKVLILYTSIGLGHKSIAENIGYWLTKAGAEVRLEDVLKVQQGKLVSFATALHRFINKYLPFVWSWLYKSNLVTNLSLPQRLRVAKNNYKNTLSVIENFHPDLVITTQTTASAILAYLKKTGLYKGKFAITFSDFHLHKFWLYDEADFYLANIIEQKQEMISLGVVEDKIFVCGMTLKPKEVVEVFSIRKKLQLAEGQRVILVSSGSLGIGLSDEVIAELLEIENCKVVVVCGKNTTALEHLQKTFFNKNFVAYGFYSPMNELYAVADIFVTKPGGLSTAESLRWNLPMLVTYVLPGQEELNYDYLQEKGLIMPEPVGVCQTVREEILTGNFRNLLALNKQVNEILPNPEILLSQLDSILI